MSKRRDDCDMTQRDRMVMAAMAIRFASEHDGHQGPFIVKRLRDFAEAMVFDSDGDLVTMGHEIVIEAVDAPGAQR